MTEQDLLNEPVTFGMGSKTIRLRKIGSAKKRAIIESYYIENCVRAIQDKAKVFATSEKQDAYMTDQLDKLPSGQALMDIAGKEKIDDEIVLRFFEAALVEDLRREESEDLWDKASQAQATSVLYFIHDGKKKSFLPKATGAKRRKSSPKKGTRRKK